MKNIRQYERIWYWLLRRRLFYWIFKVNFKLKCYKKTGCPAF